MIDRFDDWFDNLMAYHQTFMVMSALAYAVLLITVAIFTWTWASLFCLIVGCVLYGQGLFLICTEGWWRAPAIAERKRRKYNTF